MPPPSSSRTPAPPTDIARVLLIHPGALGDLVQATPAFGAVRAGLPRAQVVLLTDAALADLAGGMALFDEVLSFDAALAYRGRIDRRARLLFQLAARVRAARADAVAVFKGAAVWPALAAASGARWRVGLARGFGLRFLHRAVAIDPARHHEDRYLDVAAALGVDPSRRTPTAWPPRGTPVPAVFRGSAWPLVGLAPGGARNAKQDMGTKRWPTPRFAALARELASAYPNVAFVLLGGPGDRGEIDDVRTALHAVLPPERVLDLAGRTDVPAARAAIATLDVYVGNDSGLMHLAATTDTPSVIIFGPTDPRVLAPRTPRMRAIWNPAPAPPCFDEVTGSLRSCQTSCCIDRVQVAEVRAAIDAALAPRRA